MIVYVGRTKEINMFHKLIVATFVVHIAHSMLLQDAQSMLRQNANISNKLLVLESKVSKMESKNQELTLKIKKLEFGSIQQEHQLIGIQERISKSSEYCKLLPNGICGPCFCLDDYELQQKYYCDCQDLTPQRDCLEFHKAGLRVNGIYKVTMNNLGTMQVYCDQTTDGGGWTTIQRRADGSINFYRNWKEYKQGFEKYQNEFYFGNENLYVLTLQSLYPKGSQLRVDMTDWEGNTIYAKYSVFQVGNEQTKYRMHVSGYTGDGGDSFGYHNDQKFSTYDQDNDESSISCSHRSRGGWWYNRCSDSNLNGEYRLYGVPLPGPSRGLIWSTVV